MTDGAGILHEEFRSEAFTRSGGMLEMVQLWVNLPAKDKMTTPGYQAILNRDIPTIALPDGAGTVRVIAGDYKGHVGPAHTLTPMQVWDLRLNQRGVCELSVPDGWNSALIVLRGTVLINNSTIAREAQLVLMVAQEVPCLSKQIKKRWCCCLAASRLTSRSSSRVSP